MKSRFSVFYSTFSETLDGINIELRHGESQFMNVFIERLHEFRKSRPEVQDILITFSSTCDYPDLYLGPDYGKPLEDEVAMELIDQVCLLKVTSPSTVNTKMTISLT